MVDHLYGDAAGGGFGEWAGGVAVEAGPGVVVNFGFQRGFQRLVRIVCAEEVGVADEEAFFVAVSVDEPAGDTVRAVATHFASVRAEYVHTVDLDHDVATVIGRVGVVAVHRGFQVLAVLVKDVDIGFAEDDEHVALAGVLQVLGHVQVGIHARFQHRDAAELVEIG